MHRVVRCAYWLLLLMQSPPQWHALHVSTIDQIRNCVCSELPVLWTNANARGALRLRGGAGGGPRTRVEGGSRKGQWLGLKRSADGGHVIQEECASKRRKPSVEEEQALYEKEAAEHEATLNAHRSAGLIATQALKQLVEAARPGRNVSEICLLGDELVVELLRLNFPTRAHLLPNASMPVSVRAKKFSTEVMGPDRERVRARDMTPDDVGLGVAHPTTLAIDHECGRSAPMPGEATDRQLRLGDLAKIEVSVHIDGCLAAAAHTFIVGSACGTPRQIAAMTAAKSAALAAIAHMRPGARSLDVAQVSSLACCMYGLLEYSLVLKYLTLGTKISNKRTGDRAGRSDAAVPRR